MDRTGGVELCRVGQTVQRAGGDKAEVFRRLTHQSVPVGHHHVVVLLALHTDVIMQLRRKGLMALIELIITAAAVCIMIGKLHPTTADGRRAVILKRLMVKVMVQDETAYVGRPTWS